MIAPQLNPLSRCGPPESGTTNDVFTAPSPLGNRFHCDTPHPNDLTTRMTIKAIKPTKEIGGVTYSSRRNRLA